MDPLQPTQPSDDAATARGALENVCSGTQLDKVARYYGAGFVDHVNGAELRGHAGVRESVARYRRMLSSMTVTVEDQVIQNERIASRFTVRGTVLGRPVAIMGITISRLEGGVIQEDWSVTDTLSLLRQIGWWRLLWLGLRGLTGSGRS
jgi:predicted ester cyclase